MYHYRPIVGSSDLCLCIGEKCENGTIQVKIAFLCMYIILKCLECM